MGRIWKEVGKEVGIWGKWGGEEVGIWGGKFGEGFAYFWPGSPLRENFSEIFLKTTPPVFIPFSFSFYPFKNENVFINLFLKKYWL